MASASQKQAFIESIAALVQKYAPQYGIAVCSPIIAQACKESAFGTSELAMRAFNYFGLKFKGNTRCPSAMCVPYYKDGSEQNPDGSYTTSAMQWFQFLSMEACVKGYFDFINIARYSNLKHVLDPETYCKLLKEDGYATSLTYASSLYNDYIVKYDLTKYDTIGDTKMYKVAINAGHWNGNPKGVPSSMPVLAGTREFTLNERVVSKVVELLKPYPNIEVMLNYDPTGNSKIELSQRVAQANKGKVDLYLSVHHNGGINGGTGGGTVVYYYQGNTKNKTQATNLYNQIKSRTGLKGNRSNPICGTRNLYEINATAMPAFLIECAFMDSKTDVYYIARTTWAQVVAEGIVAFILAESGTAATVSTSASKETNYKIKVYQYTNVYSDSNKSKINMILSNGVFTIVEEKNNMGLLKSKAGWVDLNEVNKI